MFHTRLKRGFHWQAVETGGTGLGIPDSNYCTLVGPGEGVGVEGWVEFKQTDAWAVGLRIEQISWHKSRWRYGGLTHIATRRHHSGGPRKGQAVDELWIHQGRWVSELNRDGLKSDVPVAGVWSGGPANWDWDAVKSILSGSC